jgi:pSer/pThr/pTyr-binding forkhead associated (FHA) protein
MSGRRAIVEVRWAKVPARKAVIEPGSALRVGRTERADLVIPDDRTLSAVHCEISWDGAALRVVDRSIREGILVNGEPMKEAALRNGDWIRAGGTILSVYLEGATPPRSESGFRGDGSDSLSLEQAAALAALEAVSAPLFAVLDAARSLRVIEILREAVEESRSLYEGIQGEALAMEAPYLVRAEPRSRLLRQIVLEGWEQRWGIYLTSHRPFEEVRRQLRRITMVHDDRSGERMYFRFYDPAMLRHVLPACGVRQREQIFGEIDAFLVEGRDGELLRLTAHDPPAALTPARPPERVTLEADA